MLRWQLARRAVSLHRTSCAVTAPPSLPGAALVVPGNATLVGARATYFERGASGPPPEPAGGWAASSNWCGMDAGPQMLYPAQCIDGVVGQLGGRELRASLEGRQCEVGAALATPPPHGSRLADAFSLLVHTNPPRWPRGEPEAESEWEALLASCHTSAFQAAQEAARGADQQLVVPLLGAGARGAPDERAAAAAAKAASSWLLATGSTGEGQAEVMFCVVSVAAHAALESALREATKDIL